MKTQKSSWIRRFFEWLGLIKPKQVAAEVETDVTPPSFEPQPAAEYEPIATSTLGDVDEDVPQMNDPSYQEEVNAETVEEPVKEDPLPDDANDIQALTKYNNPKTVYRDEKGRFRSRK